ncbi:MAG: DMT family transporter [Rhodobacteraceae bacterium]|nr:DMT family transporter [Paracoccaceae bacterium]
MDTHAKGLLITIFGVLFVVPDALFVRLIAADSLTIAFWRSLLSGSVIGLGVWVFLGPGSFVRVFAGGWIALVYTVFLGASGVLFVTAISLTSVANVVFIIAAMPVFAALFSRIFLGERISRRTGLTIAIVAIGLAVIAFGSGATNAGHLSGDLVALSVAATFAAALTVARKMRAVSMVPAIPLANIGAALVILPFTDIWAVEPASWPLIAMHGGGFIVASTVLLATGPRYLPSAEVALLVLLESVLAPLLVWAALGEAPGNWAMVGGAVVIAALFASNMALVLRRRRK